MKTVFISYSHTDSAIANSIATMLDELQIDYFLDIKSIELGESISTSVREGLKKASAIIVIISPGSIKSQWVAFEVGFGSGINKRVLPYITHPSLNLPGFMSDLLYSVSVNELRNFFENNLNWHNSIDNGLTKNTNPKNDLILTTIAARTTGNRIIAKEDDYESGIKKAGIIIPHSAKELPRSGIVIATGEDVTNVEIGNHITWGKYSGQEIIIDEEEFLLIYDKDVMFISER